jgi:predicted  nucleic acid-binding Zn-ribbon protein
LNEQLLYLIDLQKIDTETQKVLLGKKELPAVLARLEENFEIIKSRIAEHRSNLEGKSKIHRELEDKLKKGLEQLQKARDRIHDVKSNKEYQAVLKEIETLEQKNGVVEDQIISILEEIDAAKTLLAIKEQEFAGEQQIYDEEKSKTEEQLGSIESELRSGQKQGEEVREKIWKELLKKYEIIKNVNDGLAVVSAWKETCNGCHMNIPPQLYNELLEITDELICCPNCRRIIYRRDESMNGA